MNRRGTAIVAGAFALVCACLLPAAAQPAFYLPTTAEVAGAPGTVIRTEPMPPPFGATAHRVLYRSTGLAGEPTAASGIVVVPNGATPAGGWRIVAWAHPTSGVATKCAPSLATLVFQQIQGLRQMIDAGYVVAATDYPGLGGPGVHPYLVGESEARAVIDSVRAARAIVRDATSEFAVWGHSQGGHAALWTGIVAARYAPELKLVGVAAAAPATELATLLRDDMATSAGDNLTAMTLWSWWKVFGLPIADVVTADAMPAVDALAASCIESLFDLLERRGPSRELQQSFLSVSDLPGTEPWKTYMDRNQPGDLPSAVPVFIAQGAADTVVRPQVTTDYAARLCRNGSHVVFVSLPGVTHLTVAHDAAAEAVAWIGDRFAGAAPPSTCGR